MCYSIIAHLRIYQIIRYHVTIIYLIKYTIISNSIRNLDKSVYSIGSFGRGSIQYFLN